jgi:hypothetical protein
MVKPAQQSPKSFRLSAPCIRVLDACAEELGVSRRDAIEIVTRALMRTKVAREVSFAELLISDKFPLPDGRKRRQPAAAKA